MTFGSSLLAAIPGLRHAFFTREGGVSDGIYQSLNGGLGSNDDPASVAENRRRMAEQMGVAPERLLSAHQIHSPDVHGRATNRALTRSSPIRKASRSASLPPIAARSCSPTQARA